MEHGKGDEHDRKTSRLIRSDGVQERGAHFLPGVLVAIQPFLFSSKRQPQAWQFDHVGFHFLQREERRERRAISILASVQYRRTVLTMSSLVTCSCGRRDISTLGDHVEAYSSYHCPNQHVRKRILKESDIAENQQRAQRTRRKSIGRTRWKGRRRCVHLTKRAKTLATHCK